MELLEAFEVPIDHLAQEGERVTISDIKLPEAVDTVDYDERAVDEDREERQTAMDLVIANVYKPSSLQAANETAGGDAEDESDNGSARPQEVVQNEEKRPGGKGQDEPKQSNVDTGK